MWPKLISRVLNAWDGLDPQQRHDLLELRLTTATVAQSTAKVRIRQHKNNPRRLKRWEIRLARRNARVVRLRDLVDESRARLAH